MKTLKLSCISSLLMLVYTAIPVCALPPIEDTPEEILRTEVIIEARSPIDGKPLTAAEYAELQIMLEKGYLPPDVSPKFKDLVFLLRIRKMFKSIIPF